jgi:hypothetical protein
MRILYDNYNEVTRRSTTLEVDAETGLPLLTKVQDVKPIVESAKALAAGFDPHQRRSVTHVARIPMVIWQRLAMVGITRDPVALNKWLNSREARALRCDDGRKL